MGYKYFGYFLAVIVILLGTVGGWIAVMVSQERSLLKKINNSARKLEQEGGN